jgi:RNA polymerase sigma-70 factor (ECF subfamily)
MLGMEMYRPARSLGADPAEDELAGLLEAVAGRADGAFTILYARLWPPVHAVVRQALADPGLAEDITQEVLLEIWQKAADYDPAKGSVTTWTRMIARRRAVDRRRADTAVSRTYRASGSAALWDPVVEAIENAHDHRQLRAVLQQLTELQREAVILAYYRGHTYQETAVILGIPLGTLKSRIRDALTRLRGGMTDAERDQPGTPGRPPPPRRPGPAER